MSQEILYTSAPEGLKAGSRGFCTVVSTAGMAKNLAERLESLSGYRHAFETHDPRSKHNPVNYQHLIASVGGRKLHILSRICDAGFDYTKRSNKLAHHVAIEPAEALVAAGGPAWVMTAPGFFQTAWDGETRILPESRPLRADACPTRVCSRWKRVAARAGDAGDEGWAGVLAENARARGGKPISVIYPVGAEPLPLVVEALSLLPQDQRWQVTFSTYFTKLPAGLECQWRFIFDGSPEADALRRNPHARLIDLCKPLGSAPDSELVLAARRGIAPLTAPPKARAPASAVFRDAPEQAQETSSQETAGPDAGELTLAPPERTGRASRGGLPADDLLRRRLQTAQKRSSSLVFVMGGLAALLFVVVLGLAAYIATSGGGNNQTAAHDNKNNAAEPTELPGGVGPDSAMAPGAASELVEPDADENAAIATAGSQAAADQEQAAAQKKAAQKKADEDAKAAQEKADKAKADKEREQQLAFPLSALEKDPCRLVIPEYITGGTLDKDKDNDNEHRALLGVIFNESPQNVDMELLGADILSGNMTPLKIKPLDDKKNGEQRVWQIFTTSPNVTKDQLNIARLTLEGEQLFFQWAPKYPNKDLSQQRSLLQFHALKITVARRNDADHENNAASGADESLSTQVCQLIEPRAAEIGRITWRTGDHSLVKNPESLDLPEVKTLLASASDKDKAALEERFSMELELESSVANDWKTAALARQKPFGTIRFVTNHENPPDSKTLEMEWQIKQTEAGVEVRYRFFAYAPEAYGKNSANPQLIAKRIAVSSDSKTKERLRGFGTEKKIETAQFQVAEAKKAKAEADSKYREHEGKKPKEPDPANASAHEQWLLDINAWGEKAREINSNRQTAAQRLATWHVQLQVAQDTPPWKEHVEKTLDAICADIKVKLLFAFDLEPGARVILARSVETSQQTAAHFE